MITIAIRNQVAFLWKAEDWEKLRTEHRIVGNLIGSLANLPRQDTFLGLPATLLPEEVALLLENNIACLVTYASLAEAPGKQIQETYLNYKENNKREQTEHYEKERKTKVYSMIDRIIEGKRKKALGINTKKSKGGESVQCNEELGDDINLDREEILKSELSKGISTDPAGLLAQTFTSDPWIQEDESQTVTWNFPSTPEEKLRYNIFKDLWKKGYYISSGNRFGGDYLVYPGDPIKFHAQFIVSCMEPDKSISASDLIIFGRLGTTTRKTFVIASQLKDSNEIMYQSIQWKDKT